MAKVAVVDDHPHIARLVQRELEAEGHEVITATDGDEALRRIRADLPALVVLDVVMPGKNGFQVLRELKADPATREIPVIMLTVRDQDADLTHGLTLGADWYLTKPFVPGDIAALARRFLGSE
jgi:two-component system alkaline phosphatase synthesis response regulator PhoP/two-component system response regulator VicR